MQLSLCWYSRITKKIEDANKRFNYRRTLDDTEINKTPLDIFKSCIYSHRSYRFKKIRACIEFDSSVSEIEKQECVELLNSLASESEIITRRPSNIDEWLEEALYLNKFFRKDESILFHYNHDHFFVAKEINSDYIKDIYEVNAQIRDAVIMTTDYPMWKCMSNKLYVKENHKDYLGWPVTKTIDMSQSGLKWTRLNDIWSSNQGLGINQHGEFISTAEMHLKIWVSIAKEGKNSKLPYVARPDWPGIIETGIKASFFIPPSEICTHYDGYGYLTNLTQYISPLSMDGEKWDFSRKQKKGSRNIISYEEVSQFKRDNYLLISRIYSICNKDGRNSRNLELFHNQIQEITTRWSEEWCIKEFRKGKIATDNLGDMINPIKAALMEEIDKDMSSLMSDIYM